MTKRIAPREGKAQELTALLQGHAKGKSGAEWLRTWVQLAAVGPPRVRGRCRCNGVSAHERPGESLGVGMAAAVIAQRPNVVWGGASPKTP